MKDLRPPSERDTSIYDEGKDDIEDHPTGHDHQTSERLLAAELIGLRLTGHRLCIQRLIDHTSDLAVAPEREPAKAVDRTATLTLPLEDREPGVEEEIELLYTRSEETGHRVMPQLVDEDEDGEREEELKYTNHYIHWITII